MDPAVLDRQNLATFRPARISHRFTDILVIGSGVAGLSAAIAAARERSDVEVLLIAKADLADNSTNWAQGGIAAVLEPERQDDAVALHVEDTLQAACGLADPAVVELVASEGVEAVRELIAAGARFDRHDNAVHFTREGGHSRARILHAADSTGHEIEQALLSTAARIENITPLPMTFAVDLVTDERGRCRGSLVYRPTGVLQMLWAGQVILASGGAGRLYRETTNPPVTTGDGLAMAFRAGATLQNLEFVQFHPTTLYVAGADRFLITEAARGEGGKIIDEDGVAFMKDFHPDAELAPRDVVSRAIVSRMKQTGSNKVFLDLRSLGEEKIQRRFPRIRQICAGFGIDILAEPIPVRPSAHYTIGGVRVDTDGTTDVDGLFAAGEVASTGLHGANRLGSNSLLEGLVFGRRAGVAAARRTCRDGFTGEIFAPPPVSSGRELPHPGAIDIADMKSSLQSLLWHRVGIERRREELELARAQVQKWISYVLPLQFHEPDGWTLQNMLTTAGLIVHAALGREESRGVHYRSDFPQPREEWRRQQTLSRAGLGAAQPG